MRYLKICFNMFLLLFSYLIPKSEKYVIVGGWYGKRYADNSKGIFLYLNKNKQKLGLKKVYWYTKDEEIYNRLRKEGFDVLKGYSLKAIFWHMRSKTHFIDQNPHDILGFLSIRCHRINLWHGLPLKKIGYQTTGEDKKISFIDKIASGGFWADQFVLATSDLGAKLLSQAMGISKEKCVIASYPRTEGLFKDEAKKIHHNIFNVFYLPTLRNKRERNPFLDMDLEKINDLFAKNGIMFQLKPHPASIGDWSFLQKFSNFQILNASTDVYDILAETDLLITDYSSVYFDYMLTGKALLFFPYDYEEYLNDDRGFNLPFETYTPGEKVYTVRELIDSIVKIKENYSKYQKKYENQYAYVNDKVNLYHNHPNYKPIIDIILK